MWAGADPKVGFKGSSSMYWGRKSKGGLISHFFFAVWDRWDAAAPRSTAYYIHQVLRVLLMMPKQFATAIPFLLKHIAVKLRKKWYCKFSDKPRAKRKNDGTYYLARCQSWIVCHTMGWCAGGALFSILLPKLLVHRDRLWHARFVDWWAETISRGINERKSP